MIAKCKSCKKLHDASFGSGQFCSVSCANRRSRSKRTREKIRSSIKKSKKFQIAVDRMKKSKIPIICKYCSNTFYLLPYLAKHRKFCSVKCSNSSNKLRCSSLEERKRLRDIGRKGGFGKRGKTKKGIPYQSLLEKACYEYLENSNISFEHHRNIPNSSKISDIYFPHIDLWVEIDGIDRDKRKKWLEKEYKYWVEKIEIYRKNNLNFEVVKSLRELKELPLGCEGSTLVLHTKRRGSVP